MHFGPLRNRLLRKTKSEDGFTLIEILVVILIIGILASIAIPVFLNQRQKANEAKLRSEMKSVATWLETNKIDTGDDAAYPRMFQNWKTAPGNPGLTGQWNVGVPISPTVGMAIADSGSFATYFGGTAAKKGEGFCLEGQIENSAFWIIDNGSRLAYNSLKGGFTDTCKMP